MIGRIAIAAAGNLVLAACSTQAAPAPPPPGDTTPVHGVTPGHNCDNSNIQQFVGRQRSADLEAEMLKVSNAAFVRWAPFGTMVTMEFRADRLTVFLDANNRVERISCS
jgi:hypothetical protein